MCERVTTQVLRDLAERYMGMHRYEGADRLLGAAEVIDFLRVERDRLQEALHGIANPYAGKLPEGEMFGHSDRLRQGWDEAIVEVRAVLSARAALGGTGEVT